MAKNTKLPTLEIVIVNWNSGEQLSQCLRSIETAKKTDFVLGKVIVVDNASSDGSLSDIDRFNLSLNVIKNKANDGFARACNQGAADCGTDYILFLNPDTKLFENSMIIPINFMESKTNKNVAVSGIQMINKKGKILRSCANFPSATRFIEKALILDKIFPTYFPDHFMSNWDHKNTRFVDHVTGAFFLVRTNIFKEFKGFDERFFVYLEDLDFSYRINKAGLRTVYLSNARAYHKGGGTSQQDIPRRLSYSFTSRLLYINKYYGPLHTLVNLYTLLSVEFFTRIVFSSTYGFTHTMETIKGYMHFILHIPRMFKTMVKYGRMK